MNHTADVPAVVLKDAVQDGYVSSVILDRTTKPSYRVILGKPLIGMIVVKRTIGDIHIAAPIQNGSTTVCEVAGEFALADGYCPAIGNRPASVGGVPSKGTPDNYYCSSVGNSTSCPTRGTSSRGNGIALERCISNCHISRIADCTSL